MVQIQDDRQNTKKTSRNTQKNTIFSHIFKQIIHQNDANTTYDKGIYAFLIEGAYFLKYYNKKVKKCQLFGI